MALIKNGQLVEDLYRDVSAEAAAPEQGAIIVSLEQWQEQRESLLSRDKPLGIVLRSDQHPEAIEGDISHFSVIALDFPVFRDGRAYSFARLLRSRYHFHGELRAVGDVLLEQLHYMHRTGFNAFEIKSDDALKDWQTAAADFTAWYQPTGDDRDTAIQIRHKSD
jgi:uncharacterized protein (DUF934 family)